VPEDLMRDRARAMRREPTDVERRLWQILRGRRLGGHKFRRQAPIGPYIVDFVCLAQKLVIELDGGQHADNARDIKRDAWLQSRGYRVLRFWNAEVTSNGDAVLHAIAVALGLGWTV
jgi:very-short-patch-repair endonuclease